MPKPGFRRQFAWLPVLLILLAASALIIGAIVLRYVAADLVARSGETLALAAVDIADKLDRVLFERYGDIQVLAETPVLQGSDPEAMAAYLTLVQRTNPAYVWIGVVNAAGRIVAATDPTSVGQDRNDRSWFQAVRDDLSVHVQDAQPSEDAGGVMAVGFTAPLRGKGGEFLGAVTTRVELQVLEDVFARTAYAIELQRGASARIEWQFLNRDGDVILDSLLRQEMKVNLKRLGLPSAVLSLEGEPGYIQEEHLRRKVPVITGYAKTGGYGRFTDLQWGVLVRMDRSEVLAPIRAVLWKLGLAGAVLWGPLFGLLLWSVWRLRVEWAHVRESEAAIREGENRFRGAFEETAIGMVLLEPNGRFLRVNRAFCAMVGYAEDELLTKTFQAITHPDDLDRNIKDVEKLLAGEIPFSRIEKRYLHKLGQTIWVHVNVSLVRDARGAPRYFIAQSQDITERKQAEEQLRQSEERFRKMFDDAPIGMATVGLDYRFIRVNKTLCNMLGYTDQELTGKTFADITYHEDIKEDIRLAEQVFKGEIPSYDLEKRYVKKDGELVWIHLTATVLRNQAGEVLYGLAMIEDITARKQAVEALRTSEQQFSGAFENAAIGMALVAPDGRWLKVNHSLCDLTGYSSEELLSKTFQDITHPDDLERDLGYVRQMLTGEIPTYHMEKRYFHKLGHTIWILLNVSLVRDAQGQPMHFISQIQDITERKRAEEQLRQSEERFRKTFDDAPIGMATVDSDYRFMRVNKSLCDMLGYAEGELVGKTFLDITHPDDKELGMDMVARLRLGEIHVFELEKRYLRKNQTIIRVHITVTGIHDQDGKHLYNLAMVQDITERRRTEEQLRESEERFRTLIENAPICIHEIDLKGCLIAMNPAGLKMMGVEHETQIRDLLYLDVVAPEDRERIRALLTRACAGGESEFEFSAGTDQGVRRFASSFIPIRSSDGSILRLMGITQDITERKRAEERQAAQVAVSLVLAESATLNEAAERVLHAIGDTVGWELGLVWQVDREAAVLRCETLWQISTLKTDEFVALSRAMTFPSGIGLPGRVWASGEPAWIADVVKDPNFPRAPAAAKLGLHGAFGFPVKSQDETLGVIEFFSREIRQPDNSLLAMMADIGLKIGAFVERMRAEETARASEERFRLAIDHAGDAVLYIDGKDAIVWANHQASVITGQPLETLVGKSLMAAFAAQPLAKAQLASIGLGKAVPPMVEFEVFLRDGTSKWLEVTITHVRKGEEVVGWLLVARDRTERRQIERQLRQSEKMASLGLLLDGVAHEINNPLFMISGFTQLADEKVKKGQYETLADDLASIRQAVDRATEIIQRTMTVARRTKTGGEPCQVNSVAQQTLDLAATGLASDKITLSKKFQTGLPPVLANPRELSQVFSNLIDNARRAMASAQRRGTLIVTTALVPNQPKPWVELRVIDDGPGVAPELQPRIFEPFPTAQQGSKGTGLSLAICHRVVTELGGTLTLESKVGQGATFIVRLPALEAMAS